MSWLFYESFHIIDGMITTFLILFLSLLVLVLLLFFTKNILLLNILFYLLPTVTGAVFRQLPILFMPRWKNAL